MKKILFYIQSSPGNTALANETYMPPLGLLSIASHLRMNGYDVEVTDLSMDYQSTEEQNQRIRQSDPLFIAFSAYTQTVDEILNMCAYLKKKFPEIPLAIGGAHPTVDPEYCRRKRCVDFLLLGDGEETLLDLAAAIETDERLISFDEIPGLVFKRNGKFSEGLPKQLIESMDLLPVISRDFIPQSLSSRIPTVYSSRGCPGRCIYCAASSMSGRHYRVRDIENVFLESLYMVDHCEDYSELFYCDDTFTVFRKRLERFVELCDACGTKFAWRCESRVDAMYHSRAILPDLRRAGCRRIQYGIESGNQEVLIRIRKGLDLQKAGVVIRATVDAKIRAALSFMFGHFCDTIDTMNDTIQMILQMKERYGPMVEVAHGLNTPFPGTYQYEHRDELGIHMISDQYSDLTMSRPVIYTDAFSAQDLREFDRRMGAVYQS